MLFSRVLSLGKRFIYGPAWLSWSVPLLFYLYHLAPSVQLEDAGEFTAAALTWGIPHPSGYPLYVLLAGSWANLWGGGAWAVNLFSALAAALTCLFVYLTGRRLGAGAWLAMLGAWLVAGWPAFWSQAVVAEVYTLHAALVAVWLYVLVRWRQKPVPNLWYLLCFLTGLAISNHLLSVFLVPLWLWSGYKQRLPRIGLPQIFFSVVYFVLGLTPYVYLLWRVWQAPLLNWGQLSNWSEVGRHILRLSYNDIGLVSESSKVGLLISFLNQFIEGWGWPLIILTVVGAGWLIILQNHSGVSLLLAVFLWQSLPVIILRQFGWGLGLEFTYRVYWLGAAVAIGILSALSLTAIMAFIETKLSAGLSRRWLKFSWAGVVILMLPWSVWFNNLTFLSYRQDNFPADYARQLLLNLPPRAILYIGGEGYSRDSILFLLAYVYLVEGYRPDVMLVDGGPLFLPADLAVLTRPLTAGEPIKEIDYRWLKTLWQYAEVHHRPLYSTSLVGVEGGLVARPDGYAYRIFGSAAEAKMAIVWPRLYQADVWTVERLSSYSGQDFLASLNYFQSAAFWQLSQPDKALNFFLKAIKYDNEPFSLEYQSYIRQRAFWQSFVKGY